MVINTRSKLFTSPAVAKESTTVVKIAQDDATVISMDKATSYKHKIPFMFCKVDIKDRF
jgi:hypothetical protein